ncbi:hypothetical protein DFH08DRAFT_683333, partial [Mycena albidolilacea]
IAGLRETSVVLIQGLDMLQELHPFVQLAVNEFKLVMTLEMAPLETSKKVLVVSIQMQDMMSALFQLRNIRGSYVKGRDGLTLENRMSALIKSISDDIERCGNICDVFVSKDVLGKISSMPPLCYLRPRSAATTIRSDEYELLFAEFVTTFHTYKQKIAFDVFTTSGNDAANKEFGGQEYEPMTI